MVSGLLDPVRVPQSLGTGSSSANSLFTALAVSISGSLQFSWSSDELPLAPEAVVCLGYVAFPAFSFANPRQNG